MSGKKLWGGRFQGKQDPIAVSFTESFSFDQKLWGSDVAVLGAHVRMLSEKEILSKAVGDKIVKSLTEIKADLQSGKLALQGDHEDIHSFIEAELEKRIGEEASLIRLGRSRNDTVVTDLRLYLKGELAEILQGHHGYMKALIALAERFPDAVVPGYTHFRKAQPILFPFYCLAHFSAGKREHDALQFALKLTDVSTLGAGAVSGTSWPIDPAISAKSLGFAEPFFNALDAVSDRDFLLSFYFAETMILTHFSRFCEDLILWSGEGLSYIELPDALCTGSSLMPQKKNPDPLELLRGKTARALGHVTSLFMLLKGLPMGYNRDLQEDKEPLFDAVKTLKESIYMMTKVLEGLSINKEALKKVWEDDFAVATDLADELVKLGYSFAEAHHLSGQIVRYCHENKKAIRDLKLEELEAVVPKATHALVEKLSVEASANNRNSPGGTGKHAVAESLKIARQRLQSLTR